MPNSFFRPINPQVITVAAISAACTNPFGPQTSIIRLATGSVGVWYATGVAPVATNASIFLPANWFEYITATPGEKIAVIQPTAPAGTFSVSEMTN